jgi:hypothetical protein
MATIKINGITLLPQPARDTWEVVTGAKLNSTDAGGL